MNWYVYNKVNYELLRIWRGTQWIVLSTVRYIQWIVYLHSSTVPPDPFTFLSYASMAITHAHRFPADRNLSFKHSTLNIGSVIKSLRILAIAIGCQEKQNIAKSTNRDTWKHKNETMQFNRYEFKFVDDVSWEKKTHITTGVSKEIAVSFGTFSLSFVYYIEMRVVLISDFCHVCDVLVSVILMC